MKINGIKEEDIIKQAKIVFKDCFIKVDEDHIFLKDVEKGCYESDWLDHKFYVNTSYAYEDVLVNKNQTRYLINCQSVWVKENEFDLIYNPDNNYYYVIEDEKGIQFMKPNDYFIRMKQSIKKIED
ncbi:MAG: hypothetical protein RSC93_06620 [Erysipelotrichaceae bacterium]